MIEKTEFKRKKILVITDDERKYRRISFGINKAMLILQNIKAIEEFVRENETTR